MKDKITIYQKPTCSKCRITLKTMDEKGLDYEAINYYQEPFDFKGLKTLISKLKMKPRDLMRKNETLYKDLHLSTSENTDDELIALMVDNPDLIQRPIVIKGDKAVLVRGEAKLEDVL